MTRLKIGLSGKANEKVTFDKTAVNLGSGMISVYATPAMTALMEKASLNIVEQYLQENETSVGISLNIRHLAPTPTDMEVTAQAELIDIDKKRLVFKITAEDDAEIIGDGVHERIIVNKEGFLSKAHEKNKLTE